MNHPKLVPCVKSFIEQSSAEAHLRRGTSTMYTNGVSLRDIVKHVKDTLGIDLSKDTIHRLMQPPRKQTCASKNYKSLVNARVPLKRNSKEKKVHPHFQYTCSQVNLVNEMAHLCEKNTMCMSVDNKNKVEVAIPATSRRSKIRTFHLINQAPNYNDHDFPNPNCKLVPAGYQTLLPKFNRSRSLSPRKSPKFIHKRSYSEETKIAFSKDIINDKLGRPKIKWPRSGSLLVQLYPSRAVESTNIMHTTHLMLQIKEEMKIKPIFNVVAIADGGPDWSVKGIGNLITLGMLWKDLGLDCLVVQCYAPGHSRFNPIERTWSFDEQNLHCYTLPDEIDGKKPSENDEKRLARGA